MKTSRGSAVFLVETSLGVGDMFFAWLERCKALRFPVYFIGATSDPVTLDWFQHHTQEEMVEKLLSQDLKLPGFQCKGKETPADVLLSPPPAPQFNLCSLRAGPTMAVPDKIMSEWATHPTHGHEFQDMVKAIFEEFGEPKPAASRPAADDPEIEPSPKRRRVADSVEFVDLDRLPGTKLAEAAMAGVKKDVQGKIMVQVDMKHEWWVSNTSDKTVSLAAGIAVAGFGAGQFQHQPRQGNEPAQVDTEKLLLFDMTEADLVLYNNKLETLGDLLHTRQVEKGKANISYHEVTPAPGDNLKKFDIVRKHEVYFKPTAKVVAEGEAGGEIKLHKGTGSFASLVPVSTLKQLKHAQVVWSVKWALKGLVPVKPYLCILEEIILDSKKAVKL